jgi:leader peptidase (prepilin peptidase)/N-methyltransferase
VTAATAAAAVVYVAALAAISVVDVRERRVPNVIVLPAAAAVLALRTLGDPSWEWLLGGLVAFACFFVLALIHPPGLGMGDVKLMLLIGSMLGRETLLAVVVGMGVAAIPSLVLLARGRRGATLPLAPFLALGGVAVLPLAL